MKRYNITKNILRGLASLILLSGLPALTSCSSDDDMPQQAPVAGQTVGFTIAVPRAHGGTRSEQDPTWGDDYRPDDNGGDEFENTVKTLMSSLYIMEGNNIKPVGTITVNTSPLLTKIEDDSEYYYIEGELHTNLSADQLNKGKFRLMVEANTESSHSWMPNRKYFMLGTQQSLLDEGLAIPMWGVAEANFTGVGEKVKDDDGNLIKPVIRIHPSSENTDELATVSLLRAAAKVTVKLDKSKVKNVILKKLTLNTAAKEGFIFPESWNSVSSTENLKFSETFHPFDGTLTDGKQNLGFYSVKNPDDDSSIISFYLAETPLQEYNEENHSDDSKECTELRLDVEYVHQDSETDVKTGSLYFTTSNDATVSAHEHKDDPNITEQPIIRNHIYEFTITGVADSFKPEVKLCIKKWSHEQISIDL